MLKKETQMLPNKKKDPMRLFVKIEGLSPFVLRLHKNLKIHHYIEITEQYYGELYGGRPPGNIYINRVINFANDDKLMEFRRQETISSKFILQTQETTPIYDEYYACEEAISFGPSPAPFLYPHPIPKIVSLNRLILIMSDPMIDDFFTRVWFWSFRGLKVAPDLFMKKLFQRFEIFPLEPETRDPKQYGDKIMKVMMASGNYYEQNTNTNTKLFQSAWSQNIMNVYTQLDKIFFEKTLKPLIQRKVCAILYQFVKDCFFDFNQDMITMLEKFCNERLTQNEILKNYGQQILDAMKTTSRKQHYELFKEIDWEQVVAETIAKFPPPEPDFSNPLPINTKKYPDLSKGQFFTADELLTINLNDFADQLTFMDKYQYNLIQYSELIDQCWSKENKRFKAPNLMRSINFLNKVSAWVSYHVLSEKDEKKRRELLKFFIRLTVRLMDLNSLNMMQAVNAGLTTTAVHRLSLTWDQIEEKITSLRKGVDNLIATRGNFKALRERMTDCYENGKPCAPFVGVLLKDLVFFDDVDGKINFNKCVGNFVIMHHTLKFQGKEYEFAPDVDLVKKIDCFVPPGEKEMYSMSLALQPKGVGK